MTTDSIRHLDTPVGRLLLAASEAGLTHLELERSGRMPASVPASSERSRAHLEAALRALDQYFRGERKGFYDLALAPAGTAFQLQVWTALRQIPFGATGSYGELARRIDRPGAARAVGMANHRNPLGIVVPCHRVVGASGDLVGYGGGLEMKRWLLEHEGAR
jgi:methylated-DNA-[protein]-cysteine S-methyltransferase